MYTHYVSKISLTATFIQRCQGGEKTILCAFFVLVLSLNYQAVSAIPEDDDLVKKMSITIEA